MDHLAIMKKSWGMIPKIMSGEKTIESRWYRGKHPSFDLVNGGDTVYYKNSGEPVTLKAEVFKVLRYENINPKEALEILLKFGERIGIPPDQLGHYYEMYKNKKYCLLIFLRNPEKVEPFEVDKKKLGYCSRSAWIDMENISMIKR